MDAEREEVDRLIRELPAPDRNTHVQEERKTASQTRRVSPLIVGLSADTVKALLGPPDRQRDLSFNDTPWSRWYYPDGFVVEFRDDGDGMIVAAWAWWNPRCSHCGIELNLEATQCPNRGCNYVISVYPGTFPLLELPDGRVVMVHWSASGGCHSDCAEWILTLAGKEFRYFNRDYGRWTEKVEYGARSPHVVKRTRMPDGRFLVRYHIYLDISEDGASSMGLEFELLFDVEKMEVEYRSILDPDFKLAAVGMGAHYQNDKAADQGEAATQFNLGRMYDLGQGVARSDQEAVYWYRQAANQAHPVAQFYLGCMYARGRGVEQSDVDAVYWYRQAAWLGHMLAQNNLGCMYANGQGVAQSYPEALHWYRQAAEQGHKGAAAALKRLKR